MEKKQLLDEDTIIEAPVDMVQEESLDDVQPVEQETVSEVCNTGKNDDKCSTGNPVDCESNDIECAEDNESERNDDSVDNATADESEPSMQPMTDMSKIETMLEDLGRCFEQKIAVDAHKAALFDKMYDELQSYKTDLYSKILKPFVLSTIALIDDTNSFLGKLEENESYKAEKYLRNIPDDLIDILESNGVELYEEDGDVFNPRLQRAIKSVPTDNPELEKHIVRRLRKGYRWNGVILKPELVQIYKYENK